MNPEVGKIVQQLADKLGVTVQYLWAVLVRGNRVSGFVDLLFVFAALPVIYAGYRLVKYAVDDDCNEGVGPGIGGGIAFVGGLLMFCASAYAAIMGIFCPEYGALSDILSHLK